jgi:chloride channel protein, CIC family
MRAPFTSAIFALELTHDFQALPLLMIGSVASLTVTVLLMRRSILTEKIARRGHHLSREYAVDLFELTRVNEVMDINPPLVMETASIAEVTNSIENRNSDFDRQAVFVVNARNQLRGVVTKEDLMVAMQKGEASDNIITIAAKEMIVTYPDELLRDALGKMLKMKLGRLPVVDSINPLLVRGYLGRAEVLAAQLKRYEEDESEPGWLESRFRSNSKTHNIACRQEAIGKLETESDT